MFNDKDIGEYLSDEEIDAFRLDRDYLRGIEAHTPCILHNDYFGFRHFYNNIFVFALRVQDKVHSKNNSHNIVYHNTAVNK